MRALLTLVLVLALVLLVIVLVKALLWRISSDPEFTTNSERMGHLKEDDLRWEVKEDVTQDGSGMYVWVERGALVDGVWTTVTSSPVGIVQNDAGAYVQMLTELRDEAQRRARVLNAKLDTTPGTV